MQRLAQFVPLHTHTKMHPTYMPHTSHACTDRHKPTVGTIFTYQLCGKHVCTTNYCMLLKERENQRKGDFKICPNQTVVKKAQGSGASCWYLSVSSTLYSNWDVRSRMQVDTSVITLGGRWDLPMCYLCQICQ